VNVRFLHTGQTGCIAVSMRSAFAFHESERKICPEMTFDMLPNKIMREPSKLATPMWPVFGKAFELNEFYRLYEYCGGEIGDAYIFIWSTKEIEEFEPIRVEYYPATWRIFASDGGGSYFGFSDEDDNPRFFSCDPVDPIGSVTWLGRWPEFIQRVSKADYL